MEAIAYENKILRKLLWLRHGHDSLYGDDGEMQCARCLIDFKRDTAQEIEVRFRKLGIKSLSRQKQAG